MSRVSFLVLILFNLGAVAAGPGKKECQAALAMLVTQEKLVGYLDDIEPQLVRIDTLLRQNHWVPIGTPVGDPMFGSATLFEDPTPLIGRTIFGIQTFGSALSDHAAWANSPAEFSRMINAKLRKVPEVKLYGGKVESVYPERTNEGPHLWHFELLDINEKTVMVPMSTTTKAHVLTSPGEELSERELGRVGLSSLPLRNRVLESLGREGGTTRKFPLHVMATYVTQAVLFDPARPENLDQMRDFRNFIHGTESNHSWTLRETGEDWQVKAWLLKQYPELARIADNIPRLRILMSEMGVEAGMAQWQKEQGQIFGAELEVHPLLPE